MIVVKWYWAVEREFELTFSGFGVQTPTPAGKTLLSAATFLVREGNIHNFVKNYN